MAATIRIVIGQRQVELPVAIEIHELDAVRRIVAEHHVRKRLDERRVDEHASRYRGWTAINSRRTDRAGRRVHIAHADVTAGR